MIWFLVGALAVVAWIHGWYVGRRRGFDEVLAEFDGLERDLATIKRKTAEWYSES